jgi:sugar-specific transcriptional regulator TrmB
LKETIRDTLSKIGLSEKEIEVYIFLGKSEPKKMLDIARHLKMNKGQAYRLLKGLQKKGILESTLEYPTRFVAVPFEAVLDAFIKSKREEVFRIEETKKDLIDDWNNIHKKTLDLSFEKFGVIEGEKQIFHKISQMIKETQKEFFAVSSVYGLSRAENYNIFEDVAGHSLKDKIKFRFLTQLTKDDLKTIKAILKTIGSEVNIKGRDPEISSSVFPRMILKDVNEIVLFLSNDQKFESALFTNCQSIIESFYGVFQDLWKDSTDIEDIITKIETGKLPPKTEVVTDPIAAKNLYYRELDSAKEEILILTSSMGLLGLVKEKSRLKEWSIKGVNIRIMAPIIGKNLKVAQELSEFGETRHIPKGYLESTIIDRKHLFQFKNLPLEHEKSTFNQSFENTYYSNDQNYIEKNSNMLDNIWMNAFSPSQITLESIAKLDASQVHPESMMTEETKKITGMDFVKDKKTPNQLAEKTLLNKFINNKKACVTDLSKDLVIHYANAGQAVIHPPKDFNLPHLLFHILHMDKKSSFGVEDSMIILSRQKTPDGYLYIPSSFITDNAKALEFWEKFFEGFPLQYTLVKENEFHVQVQKNILFAGWTISIPLSPPKHVLPPSCIMIEGYGKVKTASYTVGNPSGYVNTNEVNYFDAFVTYMHPQSQYKGPGTDGYFFREFYATTYPPQRQEQ